MTQTVVGIVMKVTQGKPFTYTKGPMAGKQAVTSNITIDTDDGQVIVQRTGMADKVFKLPSGTKVQATFEEQVINTASGDSFTNNKLIKDGLLVLTEAGEQLPVSATGEAKPKFTPGAQGGVKTGIGYNQEGARNGMIVNASVALATARKDLSLEALIQAAKDVKELTGFVETGTVPAIKGTGIGTGAKKTTGKTTTTVTMDLEDDDDAPFDLD